MITMDKKTFKKLCRIEKKIDRVMNSDLSAEEKYDKIFSDKISIKAFRLARFDYCDPDTTYEEDTRAFVDAFSEYMSDLKEVFEV